MSWKSSQQVLSICGKSFKTVRKAFQVKLEERIPRVRKAVIKAKVGYFEESKIYLDLLNHFLGYYIIPNVCYFRVLMFSLLFYNSKHKENP